MPESHQSPQDAPGSVQPESQGSSSGKKGSPILARLRAGEEVPGYKLVDGRIQKTDGENPRRARVEPGEFDRLAAMRHVLANAANTDRTPGEKACRAWLEKSPGQFMEAFDRLEADAKKQAAGEVAAEEEFVEPTESDVELERSINELLARHQGRAKR